MPRRKQFGPALPPAMAKARREARKASKSLTKLQKVEVRKLIRAPAETKYVAQTTQVYGGGLAAVPALGFGVLRSIVSGGATFSAWNLIPALSEGVDGHQRVGNRISNVHLRSDWQFYINPALSNYPTIDATVKVFILRSKTVKSNSALQSIPAGSLLDGGDATSFDWTSTTAVADKSLDMYPVNKEQFTVMKIHKFRICKNGDSPTGGGPTVQPNMTAHQTKDFSHSYIHNGAVLYPDNNLTGNVMPTNVTYFAFVVCWDTNTFASLPENSILCSSRSHMWYKDM